MELDAFHYFTDPHVAADECRRVLLDGGHVAVRGLVPGHSDLAWLELFPSSHKARARFPDLTSMTASFATAGQTLVHSQLVEEGPQTFGQRADFSQRTRHADSILTAMTETEVDSGIANLRARSEDIEHFALSFLVYQAHWPSPTDAGSWAGRGPQAARRVACALFAGSHRG